MNFDVIINLVNLKYINIKNYKGNIFIFIKVIYEIIIYNKLVDILSLVLNFEIEFVFFVIFLFNRLEV